MSGMKVGLELMLILGKLLRLYMSINSSDFGGDFLMDFLLYGLWF